MKSVFKSIQLEKITWIISQIQKNNLKKDFLEIYKLENQKDSIKILENQNTLSQTLINNFIFNLFKEFFVSYIIQTKFIKKSFFDIFM